MSAGQARNDQHDVKAAAAQISEEVDAAVKAAEILLSTHSREQTVLRLGYALYCSMRPNRLANRLAEALVRLHEHKQESPG